jgi:hypothetical protein
VVFEDFEEIGEVIDDAEAVGSGFGEFEEGAEVFGHEEGLDDTDDVAF